MIDELVRRSKVAKEFNKSTRTICRYEVEKKPGFDRPITIAGRVHHLRSRIDAVKLLGDRLEANSSRVELLDSQKLVSQLCGLVRKVKPSGKDSIDHADGGHDDVCNVVGGALVLAASKRAGMNISDRALERALQPLSKHGYGGEPRCFSWDRARNGEEIDVPRRAERIAIRAQNDLIRMLNEFQVTRKGAQNETDAVASWDEPRGSLSSCHDGLRFY